MLLVAQKAPFAGSFFHLPLHLSLSCSLLFSFRGSQHKTPRKPSRIPQAWCGHTHYTLLQHCSSVSTWDAIKSTHLDLAQVTGTDLLKCLQSLERGKSFLFANETTSGKGPLDSFRMRTTCQKDQALSRDFKLLAPSWTSE